VIPFLHDLVERLAADHRVRVIAVGHDPAPGSWTLFGAEVVNVPVGRHSRADVARVVREVTALVGGGARGARPDVVHGWWATLPGLAATIAARRHRTPSVLSIAGGELAWLPDIAYGGGGSRGTRTLARTAIGLATTVTVATEWMRLHVQDAGGRVDEIVPLGADLRRWAIADGAAAGTDPLRLVHVGSANRVKDQTMLLHALDLARRDEPGLRLDLVGLDTLDGEHDRLITHLDLGDHVRRHGLVAHDAVPALVRGAALHLVSSRHEAGPVAVLEAAALGVPTVGTSVGHGADLAGLAAPAAMAIARGDDGGTAALATALVAAVRDEAGRRALGERALHWSRRHDADHTARSFGVIHRRLRRGR
jgi:glycosyltransferase involved in cell wall biosynthesis